MLRGLYWPESVYGVAVASEWRWVEHAAWVVFEDVFLVIACVRGTQELREIAVRTAVLEAGQPRQRPARDRAGRAHFPAAVDTAASRGGDPRQERVRREHEPRAAHPVECHHPLQRAAPGGRRRGQPVRGCGRPRQDSGGQQAPARTDQRHSRSLEDRGGQDGAAPRNLRRPGDDRRADSTRLARSCAPTTTVERQLRQRPPDDARRPDQDTSDSLQPV